MKGKEEMEKLNGLITLLGEDNEKKIKDKVTDFIIECIADDLSCYSHENYILNPEEILDFINKCKEEAFEKVGKEVVSNMINKIKLSL